MLFIAVGLIVVLITLAWSISIYRFVNQALSAEGEVIKLNSGGSHPQIKFVTQDGREIEYPQSGLIFGYKIGDRVEVLYDAQNPKNACVNTFGALWGFPVLILSLGLIFVIVGIFQ